MLADFEMGKTTDKAQLKQRIKACEEKIVLQQQKMRTAKLPVLVLIEGWGAAGKGSVLGEVINTIDPRFFKVWASAVPTEEERRKPFLWKYFIKTPEQGKFAFFDSGWVGQTVREQLDGKLDAAGLAARIAAINTFERQLADNGTLLVKCFLQITRREQEKRLDKLKKDKDTAWRVSEEDLRENRRYDEYAKAFDAVLSATGPAERPWQIIDATERGEAHLALMEQLTGAIDRALAAPKVAPPVVENRFPLLQMPHIMDVQLGQSLKRDEYEQRLQAAQQRLRELHNRLYRKRVPLILGYEGWDAAGKGGNIRRVAAALDPRGFEVLPIASPEPHELAHHYLWRFWERLPKDGHVAIFDRTWYGRVLVERVEGFAKPEEWQRAYNEINEFEAQLAEWGAVIRKFWLQIDPDTQLERFRERQIVPEKQWKITEEDWRNRDKWPQYETAVDAMLQKTSTTFAPWRIIESTDKKYARVRVLEEIIAALEDVL